MRMQQNQWLVYSYIIVYMYEKKEIHDYWAMLRKIKIALVF